MKKIISVLLCTVIICMSVVAGASSASAVTADTQEKRCSVIDSKAIIIPNNRVRIYTSNLTKDNYSGGRIQLIVDNDIINDVSIFSCLDSYQSLKTDENQEYKIAIKLSNYTAIYSNSYNFENTGGIYRWVRFKIYDFASKSKKFSEDGTSTVTLREDTHAYNFTDEGDGHFSTLIIISGGAITVTAPDKDGYVEAYICTNLGEKVEAKSAFFYHYNYGFGGTSSGSGITGLTWGDVDQNDIVDINDVTEIQKYIAGIEDFNSASELTADANNNGKVDIDDVTAIQKYIAGIAY